MKLRHPTALLVLLGSAAAVVLAQGCNASTAAGALTMTTLAGGASAARRASGECYVECRPGTHCNRATGLCDPLACAGNCGEGFACQETETGSACVPRDHNAELASRPQEPVSGAQPFGEGQQVKGPHVGVGVSSSGEAAPASDGDFAPVVPGSIASRRGASDAGTLATSDGGPPAIPPAALQLAPVRQKDAPANSAPGTAPWLDSNPWDPHHVDPVPQMSNPNQPPPH